MLREVDDVRKVFKIQNELLNKDSKVMLVKVCEVIYKENAKVRKGQIFRRQQILNCYPARNICVLLRRASGQRGAWGCELGTCHQTC